VKEKDAAAYRRLVAERGMDPERAWMIGDDIEADIRGAQALGMRAVLVRTGKFRPDVVEGSNVRPDGIVSSIEFLPQWLEEHGA